MGLPSTGAGTAEKPLVLHVLECCAGGTERHLVDLVRWADGVEHLVAVPSSHHGKSTLGAIARLEQAGASVERIELNRAHMPGPHLRALFDLRRLIRRSQPDVVHGHSSIGGVIARLATLGSSVPVVYTPHGASRFGWAILVERALRRRARRVIAVSVSEAEYLLGRRLAQEQQLVTIPNGIDPDPPPVPEEPLRSRLGLAPDVPLIGSVGRLVWQKAPEVFVAACEVVRRQVPEAHFVLIGAGMLRPRVERLVLETGLEECFHLIPALPDAAAALAELDVYALASRFEGGPYTPLEAMRAGTPVVVTDVAGNRDLVEHTVNGLVVPSDDPQRLGEAIARLESDSELRSAVIRNAKLTVAGCDVRLMARATSELYRDLWGRTSADVSTPAEQALLPVRAAERELPQAVHT